MHPAPLTNDRDRDARPQRLRVEAVRTEPRVREDRLRVGRDEVGNVESPVQLGGFTGRELGHHLRRRINDLQLTRWESDRQPPLMLIGAPRFRTVTETVRLSASRAMGDTSGPWSERNGDADSPSTFAVSCTRLWGEALV